MFSLPRWKNVLGSGSSMQTGEMPPIAEESFSALLCPVCLRDLRQHDVTDLECGHAFHLSCIKDVSAGEHFFLISGRELSSVQNALQAKEEILKMIRSDATMKQRWARYCNDNYFAKDIEFDEVIEILADLLK